MILGPVRVLNNSHSATSISANTGCPHPVHWLCQVKAICIPTTVYSSGGSSSYPSGELCHGARGAREGVLHGLGHMLGCPRNSQSSNTTPYLSPQWTLELAPHVIYHSGDITHPCPELIPIAIWIRGEEGSHMISCRRRKKSLCFSLKG